MEYKINLVGFEYDRLHTGEMKYFLRLNDLKTSKIQVGDTIIFKNINNLNTFKRKVVNINKFNNFKEIFEEYGNENLGFNSEVDYTIMDKIFSKEEQKLYDALAIELDRL